MGPKSTNKVDTPNVVDTTIKAKRGRKSKKELMAALNMDVFLKDKETINLNVSEIQDTSTKEINLFFNDTYDKVLQNDYKLNNMSSVEAETNENIIITSKSLNEGEGEVEGENLTDNQKPAIKKRGRKPKGGKIIQQLTSLTQEKEDKPNVILHLKCSMKDLHTTNQSNSLIDNYNFIGGKNDLSYDIIGGESINNVNTYYNDKNTTTISNLNNDYEDDDNYCKDSSKEIWKKLKQLEHNLHINNVNNKRSACFWDTCEFDNPPIYIPKYFINGTYHVYGCFCSPECGVAYLMNEIIDSSTKFERYHLFNHIYSKIYDYKKNIKPSPNPFYMLEKYYGNLSIQEYRSLLRNERLFLIVDKPLTRILPELHEDNDDFILNNKIIPSNNFQIKNRLQRKKQNKSSILNEKFGIINGVSDINDAARPILE
jgi:hypothetical protein